MLSPKSVDRFKEILDFEADVLIERLEETNKRDTYFNPYEELQLCSLNIITTTCLARRFENTNDPIFRKINKFLHGSMIYAGVAGDVGSFIPSLSWLDVVTRKEKEMVDFVKNYRDDVYTKLVNDALDGDAECLVKNLYQMMDDQAQDDEEIRLDNDDILVFMSEYSKCPISYNLRLCLRQSFCTTLLLLEPKRRFYRCRRRYNSHLSFMDICCIVTKARSTRKNSKRIG